MDDTIGPKNHSDENERSGEVGDMFDALFIKYVDRLNLGEGLDKQAIRAAHPELADSLIGELEIYELCGGRLEAKESLGTLGDYTLRRQIGRGGMGIVYEAWESSMNRRVALKVLPAGIAADTRAVMRFVREAQAAGKLNHPNVVSVYGMGVRERTPYYAMEYVGGETLAELLTRRFPDRTAGFQARHLREEHKDTGLGVDEGLPGLPKGNESEDGGLGSPPSVESPPSGLEDPIALASLFGDVADGLQHAHSKGVVHRDIKPSNLILDPDGRLRILDFGLARLEGQEGLTLSGDLVGTPLYMSPEQARRRKIPIDHRTDIYSLGATLYETLTGQPPFRGKDHADTLSRIIERDPLRPASLNSRIPQDLETIVLKCLRKDPDDRYRTAEALAQDLKRLVRGDPVEARPQSRWQLWSRRFRRSRRQVLAVTAFLVLALLAVWLAYWGSRAERDAKLARYETSVLDVLKRMSSGQYSLRAVSQRRRDVLGYLQRTNALSPVRLADLQLLPRARGRSLLEEAIKELRDVAAAVPERPDAHYQLAKAYSLLGRLNEARAEARRAIEYDPDFVPARALEWELATEAGDRGLAQLVEAYRGRDDWTEWWLRAYARTREEHWSAAGSAYERLTAIGREAPREPYTGFIVEALLGQGVAHLEAGHLVKAQRALSAAYESVPGFLEAGLLLGRALYLDEHEDEAAEIFRALHEQAHPEEKSTVVLCVAAVYAALGDPAASLHWSAMLPDEPLRDRLLACCYFWSGMVAEAIAAGRRSVTRDPEDPIAHRILASCLLTDLWSRRGPERAKNLTELLRVTGRVAELEPESGSARALLATAEQESRQAGGGPVRPDAPGGLSGPGFAGFFGEVSRVWAVDVNSSDIEWRPSISSDGLELYFQRGPFEVADILVARRDRTHDENGSLVRFGTASPLEEINTQEHGEGNPNISPDGLTLYFVSGRPDRLGHGGIYVADRPAIGEPFGDIRSVEELNTEYAEACPSISGDGLELFFSSNRPGGHGGMDIYRATRATVEGPFEELHNLAEINTSDHEAAPCIAGSGLVLFWSDWDANRKLRPGGPGSADIWVATRRSRHEPFGPAIPVGPPVGTPLAEGLPASSFAWPAPDSELYFGRCIPHDTYNTLDIYQATWHPDCNQNGIDDREDIRNGTSRDANQNSVPDECDTERR